MRDHLLSMVCQIKRNLDNQLADLKKKQEEGTDVNHSLHHGGTMCERLIQEAKTNVIRSLDHFLGDEYPTQKEFVEIQGIINSW